jgi:predicted RecA/RadA family phage recombinase
MNKSASLIISKHNFELVDGAMEGIFEVKKKKPWNHGTKVEITMDKVTKLATSIDGSTLILIKIITLTRYKQKKCV